MGMGVLMKPARKKMYFLSTNKATVCNTWFQKKPIKEGYLAAPRNRTVTLYRFRNHEAVRA